MYKFPNLIFIHFLAISGNSYHFDFYNLPHHFRGVPKGSREGGVNIPKSHFDKFSRHFRQFGTFMIFPKQILWVLWRGLGGKNSNIFF